MTRDELEALIENGNIELCIDAFRGMPEAARAKLAAAAVARLRALGKAVTAARLAQFMDMDGEMAHQLLRVIKMDAAGAARYRTARAAVLATASFNQWKSVKAHWLPSNEASFRILSDRRPEWLPQLVEHICDEEDTLNLRWHLVRQLVREGYCEPPRSPRYIDRMLSSMMTAGTSTHGTLLERLLADPGLLDYEIWRLFDTEPGPKSLDLLPSKTDAFPPEDSWDGALSLLARDGKLSRERLLDATLDGLSRDMHEMRARWFVAFHERLEPTPEERGARAGRYVDFLNSRNHSTVAFALKVVKDLLREDRLDSDTLVDRVEPAFHSRTKGTVKQALALLDLAVRSSGDAALKARAVRVAAHGLIHEAADVQEGILEFIERHGDREDRELRELLASRLDSIAASRTAGFAAWLELEENRAEEPRTDDLGELFGSSGSARRAIRAAGGRERCTGRRARPAQ